MRTTQLLLLIVYSSIVIITPATHIDDYSGPWRQSLESCWIEPVSQCNRVMTCAHGGEWNLENPYDSLPAFEKAFFDGADAVKGDFRVSLDNVGMVMHSSPIESYESLNCFGKYVEKMTAEECQQCKMALTDNTFITVPDMLKWANEKVNVMLCVKQSVDIPRAISTLVENNATHRAFLEIHLNDMLAISKHADWNKVFYVVLLDGSDSVDSLLGAPEDVLKQAILFEFNNWESWSGDLATDIKKVQQRGFRTFAATKDSPVTATVQNHLKLYNTGFDIAYTYNLTNAVEARKTINGQRGLSPARK